MGNEVWQKDPFLQVTAGAADPRGGMSASQIANTGGGSQTITQTIAAPGGYRYCLAAFVRAEAATSVTLLAGSESREYSAKTGWERFLLPASPGADAASLRFGIEIASAGSAQVYGIQAEAQAGASTYKVTSRGGVYEYAYLRDDQLAITKTGVNRHSCTVNHL